MTRNDARALAILGACFILIGCQFEDRGECLHWEHGTQPACAGYDKNGACTSYVDVPRKYCTEWAKPAG